MAAEYTLPGADAVDGEPSPTPAKRIPKRWTPPFQWSMPRIWARFLMRLVGELAPRSCIELGTGFGISAMYQAAALETAGLTATSTPSTAIRR